MLLNLPIYVWWALCAKVFWFDINVDLTCSWTHHLLLTVNSVCQLTYIADIGMHLAQSWYTGSSKGEAYKLVTGRQELTSLNLTQSLRSLFPLLPTSFSTNFELMPLSLAKIFTCRLWRSNYPAALFWSSFGQFWMLIFQNTPGDPAK